MRFKFTLTPNLSAWGNALPQSNLYEISEWLHASFLAHAELFSSWLGENGLPTDIDRFDQFCYSRLFIPSFGKERDRLLIGSEPIEWYLSLFPEKHTKEMVCAVFENQQAFIGDFLTKVEFRVSKIEQLESPDFRSMKFRTLSPLYLPIQRRDGSLMSISPETLNYDNLFFQRLKEKYVACSGKPYDGDPTFSFRLLDTPYSSSVIVNAGMKNELKIRGFDASFLLEADPELLRVGYEAGFGEKNTIGFGMVEYLPY